MTLNQIKKKPTAACKTHKKGTFIVVCVSGVTAHIKHCEVSILKNGEQGGQRKQEVPLI